ncbi:MAG: DUF4301 family protein [Cyclobacteriaceae bacterium]|nr:DUF4301 family protein [Cyclobacteriaceae bacterium HetDA_MAG_MS6]
MFTDAEQTQIQQHGLTTAHATKQIDNFINGFPPTILAAPVIIGDSVLKLSESEKDSAISTYEKLRDQKSVVKFVPASGAATRMFKSLFTFLSSYSGSDTDYQKLLADQSPSSVFYFFKHLEGFAFYKDLKHKFDERGIALEEAHVKRAYKEIVSVLLEKDGLNYGQLPKGLLKFHKYESASRTPVEEHIVEGCQYAQSVKGVQIHFTVSGEHRDIFQSHVSDVIKQYEQTFGTTVAISYSEQKPETDTVAVDMGNKPFKNGDGSILFRPAGHGALLENLNDIDADVIFLKNIDNVVPDRLKEETINYKKVIAGVLLDVQQQTFDWLRKLEQDSSDLDQAEKFISQHLGYRKAPGQSLSIEEARAILNRPIRVCGMVKSDGDPGGGPFWVKDDKGNISLQVVETAQIDLDNPSQKEVFNQATHFNPVDVVCGVKNYLGKKFDLLEYRDPKAGFITQKSKDGKDLKAQELPGLWNGSMAHWNTIFVEVPLITFNPVKSVNDLLKPEHQ